MFSSDMACDVSLGVCAATGSLEALSQGLGWEARETSHSFTVTSLGTSEDPALSLIPGVWREPKTVAPGKPKALWWLPGRWRLQGESRVGFYTHQAARNPEAERDLSSCSRGNQAREGATEVPWRRAAPQLLGSPSSCIPRAKLCTQWVCT